MKKIAPQSRFKNYFSFIASVLFIFCLKSEINAQNDSDLVLIQRYIPNCILDIRYAGNYNFTGKPIYNIAVAAARWELVKKLKSVNDSLNKMNLKLMIFDAYRPHNAQLILWKHFPDKRYIAPPEKGSRHSRGAAVDCSIADSIGNLLPMPSLYDSFGPGSHLNFMHNDSNRNANRHLLQSIMLHFGFVNTNSEWWHFELKNPYRYKLLNIPLESIR